MSFLSDDSLKRFGLIPDPRSERNPEGLPVGITLGRARDTALVSIGFNCAACHTSQIDYRSTTDARKSLRIDGGPAQFNPATFVAAAMDAFEENLGSEASSWDRAKFAARAIAEAKKTASRYEDFDGSADTAWQRFKMLWTVASHARAGKSDIRSVVNKFDIPEERKRLLISRFHQTKVLPNTNNGPGRTDPFADGSNLLVSGFGYYGKPHSPVRFQPLFRMNGKSSYGYTANSNSIMYRNVIQAMAVGGVTDMYVDKPTFATSVNFANLALLEDALYRFESPKWPQDLPFDAALASRGRDVFRGKCAGCHEARAGAKGLYDVRVVPLSQVGTDDKIIQQFLVPITTPIVSGNLGVIANKVVSTLVANHCVQAHLTRTQCLQLDETYDAKDNPNGRRESARFETTAPGLQADVLDGVWSLGRYLHNGSVPTIADLLEPASRRPAKFAVGHRLYDSARLGFVTYPNLSDQARADGATELFDVTLEGNSNAGHEGEAFGTNLSADDKKALLEYLKGRGW